jgi:Bacterial extracellular solute-binding protein
MGPDLTLNRHQPVNFGAAQELLWRKNRRYKVVGCPNLCWRSDMMKRRAFLGSTLSALTLEASKAQSATATTQNAIDSTRFEPLVWPIVSKLPAGVRSFAGHADTVLDVIGRIGAPPSLVIFTEGNHLMVLSSNDIVGAFPSWAKSQPQYANLDLTNIILVTLPQPILVQMIRTGGVALGNLSLEVSRTSGFYPDIFMGYPEPLRQLHQLAVVEPQARFFCKNRGVALLVRKGNPLGIRGLANVIHAGTRVALPDTGDVRAKCLAAIEALLGKPAADALVAAEVSFPGRLGIMHRDLPEMVARGYADVAFTWYHLVSYWARIFPNHFEFVVVPGAEPFFTQIASARVNDPLRSGATKAFDEFFFGRAKDVYPRYDFAPMNDNEFGASLALG